MNGEGRVKAHRAGIHAQESGADGVKCARPGDRISPARACFANRVGDNALRAALHVRGRPPRERQKQDAAGIGAVHDEVGDPMRQRIGLARSGTGNNEKRPGNVGSGCGDAMLDGAALFGVQSREIRGAAHCKPGSGGIRIL